MVHSKKWQSVESRSLPVVEKERWGWSSAINGTIGVNFSVPLSLRQSRAQVRNQELLISKDRANIQQGLHQIEYLLATSLRTIDQSFLHYEAFRDARQAVKENLEARFVLYFASLPGEILLNDLPPLSKNVLRLSQQFEDLNPSKHDSGD